MWGYAQTPNIWTICQKSPPPLMPFSRFGQIQELVCMGHLPFHGPWRPLVRLIPKRPPRMHQIYPKHVILGACWMMNCRSAAQTSQTLKLLEQALVQRVLVRFPRMFETSQWLEIENTSQNLEWCMGSKTLAIVNAIKNLSPPQLTMIQSSHISHPYSSSILIIHSCHILSLFTHIWELKISQIRIHLAFTELEPSNFTVHDTYNLQL
jgi:hypothetical protein